MTIIPVTEVCAMQGEVYKKRNVVEKMFSEFFSLNRGCNRIH